MTQLQELTLIIFKELLSRQINGINEEVTTRLYKQAKELAQKSLDYEK